MTETQLGAVDLNLLVTLDALLAEDSVSAAARRMHLSQSAVSRSLAKLRATFDDELFVRTGRGMRPTRRALELAGPLRRVMSELEGMFEQREKFDPRSAERMFEIAALDYMQLTLLVPWIRQLSEDAPGIDVLIRQLSATSKRDLESGSLDLFICTKLRTVAGVIWTHLVDGDYVCVVADDHPVKRLSLSRFCKLEHVLVAPGERPVGIVDRVLAKQGLARRVSVTVPAFMSVPYLLADSERIATVPRHVADFFVQEHGLRMLETPVELPPVQLYLGWHELHRKDPGHAWLREQLIELVRGES